MENPNQAIYVNADQTLIDALSNGESRRFHELYQSYRDRIFGFAMRRSGNPHDAEDITQETFLQVHRSISTYRGRASFSTWIFGIAHHVTCRHFRRQDGATSSIETIGEGQAPAEVPFEERRIDAARTLKRCTDTLTRSRSPEHMEIFRLFYGESQPVRAIAKVTGRPADSVKDSLRRSRKLLVRDLPELKMVLEVAESA
ncbi:MAG: sigma-70 family RNA polymerase sigma factor [Myxococcota bacterium]